MYLKSERIYTQNGLESGYLEVKNDGTLGRVTKKPEGETVDYSGACIIPGIFDTHNHGAFGYSLFDMGGDKAENVRGYLRGIASQGVTNVFASTDVHMIAAAAAVAKEGVRGARIAGIHSEGPWLSRVGEKGVRTPWPAVSLDTAQKMLDDGGGLLKLVAIAPEIPGAQEIIDFFLKKGVKVALAHSDMNYSEAMGAFDRGVSVSTHTGNVMTGLHHRDIGGLGAALTHPGVDCEIICDGMHVCLEMLDIYFRVKDYSRFMMISDCTPLSGAPVGNYGVIFGDKRMSVSVREDGFVLTDTGRLMGSSQPVLYGIGNLVEKLHIPIETVIRMASLNPARKYGFTDTGELAPGKRADIAVISDDYRAVATYCGGKKVFDSKTDLDLFNPEFVSKYRAG